MSDAKRTKNYIVFKLRKNYREGKLDTSQVARLKAIGFNFDGAVFNASKDSLAVQYPAIAEEWDKERNVWVWRKTCTSFSSGHPAGYVKELSEYRKRAA